MSKERERDVYWFKKVYSYLTEDRGWKIAKVAQECGLNTLTVKKLINATKSEMPGMRPSTWAKVQDLNEKYKGEVDEMDYTSATDETIRDLANGIRKAEDPDTEKPKTLGECDEFDLLRALKAIPGVSIDIAVNLK